MARNAWFLQRQADILAMPVLQSAHTEATALGAAYLAGLRVGIWPDTDTLRRLAAPPRRYVPAIDASEREQLLSLWHRAVRAVIDFYRPEEPPPCDAPCA
jgi:glycerol kinase